VAESTPLTHAQRGALGARALNARLSPDERKEASRRAYLAGAVNAVVSRAPELTPEQRDKLRAIFSGRAVA
jgi:hypothetical protein